MKKIVSIIVVYIMAGFSLNAQMVSQYTMWNQNHYLVNPAAAGNLNYTDVGIGYRKQWTGVKNAPQTFYATIHSVLNKPKTFERSALRISSSQNRSYRGRGGKKMLKHALGANLSTNEFGAFKNSSVLVSYALHLPIYNDLRLSFGVSGGLNNYGFDESRAIAAENNDPIYEAYVQGENSNKVNANSGIYLYSDRFFVGYSANQLLQNNLELADIQTTSEESNLKIHHFVIGGYHFDLTNDFRLTPTVMIKKLDPNPISYDINLTLSYRQEIYIGVANRGEDAISVMLGMQLNNYMKFGYSYDYTISELSERSTGSHELFIGLTLF